MKTLTTTINKLFQSQGFKKYFQNTFWLLFEKVGMMGISFVISALVARYLGPHNMGVLSYAQSITTFIAVFGALGLETLTVRDLVARQNESPQILGTAFILRAVASSLSGIILLFSFYAFSTDMETNQVIVIFVLVTMMQSFHVVDYYYQANVISHHAVKVRMIQFIVTSAMKVGLIFLKANLLWFAAVFLVNEILTAGGYCFIYQRKYGNIFQWKLNFSYAKDLLKKSFPVMISGFAVIIYMRIDQVMIKHLMNTEATGIYYIAVRLSEIWNMLPGVIIGSLFPAIINAKQNDEQQYRNRVQRLFTIGVVLAFAIALPITLLGSYIIDFLYGFEYMASNDALIIHVWSNVFIFLGVIGFKCLVAEDKQHLSLYFTIAGGVVNIGLNFLLIPIWGIQGAAAATLVSQIVASYLGYVVLKSTRSIFGQMTKSLFFVDLIMSLKDGSFLKGIR